MKKNSIIYILVAFLSFGMVSCEDMLSPDSERHSYEVAQDTLYSYWGIIRSMQNIAERYVVLGECRGELVKGTSYLSDSIQAILDFDREKATDGSCRYLKASDYYHVINSCNAYLASYDSIRTTGTLQPYMKKEAAQVQAIRAWVYLQLVQVYGEVPFYTEPLLTTDNISAFMKNHPTANADNLADLLVDDLESAAEVEMLYGYPQYNTYGRSAIVCHSSKCMIPVNLILGDLFLTKGDAISCARAAQYYHNYLTANGGLSTMTAGGAIPEGYFCYGYKGEGDTETQYIHPTSAGAPWNETGAQSRLNESITAIPSSTNKLWGTVLRGVNELYGYDSKISVRTSEEDTTTTASITLIAQYDKKQLAASTPYFELCKQQQFEEYIGNDVQNAKLTVDTCVGDARQYWVRDVYQTYSNGVINTEKFITKQSPSGGAYSPTFSTVFPMIYRKAQVWLRYAEALCGAGYPSYAFAILKDGLCNNSSWIPTPETKDYEVKEWEFSVVLANDEQTDTLTSTISKEDLIEKAMGQLGLTEEDSLYAEALAELETSVDSVALSYENWPAETTNKVLDYIDQQETLRGGNFINFSFTTLVGGTNRNMVILRPSLTSDNVFRISDSNTSDQEITNGIHARGCGYVKSSDRHNQAFNYVDMVKKKAEENYGVSLEKEDIYSGDYKDIVQKCVEDLIVDEEALELAFEGTRFFDLMRVAHRRGDASYLANKLALRDEKLRNKLSNEKNWYFPLP